jgi:hypothetical protein
MSTLIEQIDSLEPGTLRVFRDSGDDIGFREALIFVDGEEVGWVDFKHVLEVPIHPGSHTIRAFNRVLHSKTLEFEAKPGERLTFQVANVGGVFFKFFMMLCMGIPGMRLTQELSDEVDSSIRKQSKRMLR